MILIISGAGPSIQDDEKVSIKNQLSNGALIVHCHSGDDDLGAHLVSVGSDWSWSFSDEMFGNTLYWCHLAVHDRRIRFNAYKDEGKFRGTTHWVVDDGGVHSVDEGFLYPWC
ncbi:S-protein homolog 2 [Linum perenne]